MLRTLATSTIALRPAARVLPRHLALISRPLPVLVPRTLRNYYASPVRLAAPGAPEHPYPKQPLPENPTVSQRLKHLFKTYGWYALGVYFAIGAVDFCFSFAAINVLGADLVSHWAAEAKHYVASLWHAVIPTQPEAAIEHAADNAEKAERKGNKNEGLVAMVILAYTIHKTVFLPVRVGLTAAFTPRIVGWLVQRGWAGSQGTRRAVQHARDKYGRNKDRP